MATKYSKENNRAGMFPVTVLLLISSAIVILGFAFAVYAILNNISFSVMGAKIHAALFAAVVVFLGARYFLATVRLRERIKGRQFSWKNFKKQVNENEMKGRA